MASPAPTLPLHGRSVVITRPVGAAAALLRRVRAAGGVPLHVPGLSLRGVDDGPTRAALAQALRARQVVFTSPAAVRFAHALHALPAGLPAVAVGRGTARALQRAGVRAVQVPARQDSEGVLALPALATLDGIDVALVGAPGGRGVLRQALAARGARLQEVHVYHRTAPRLDRRHAQALQDLPDGACVLWSSAEALGHLRAGLPAPAWAALLRATAVVSSARLAAVTQAAGWAQPVIAASALPDDLLAAAADAAAARR